MFLPLATLSRRIAQASRALEIGEVPPDVVEKVKIAFIDVLSAAFESLDLPWGCQATQIAARNPGGKATVIGAPFRTSASEAAFVNAVLGHGLVREDMHTGSVSHLGVVIYPALLALAESRPVTGRDFIVATVCGYEMGAAVGRAVMDQEVVRVYRPTGICGPIGGAVAGSRLLGLSEDATVSAVGFAANTTVGLNEWPAVGADEMFFQVGFAARNAVASVELAELGAFASETSLDGKAGLFAALRRSDRVSTVKPFSGGTWEIMSVFHKAAPACNYAQTPCQAALAVALEDDVDSSDIAKIHVKCTTAAVNYPGCNHAGPFERILQAKMSIHFCVAATLARRCIEEQNYRMLTDPEITRLASATTVEADAALTANYPKMQGAEVIVTLRNGETRQRSLCDLIPATPDQIRARFRVAAEKTLGPKVTGAIEESIDGLENQKDVAAIVRLLFVETIKHEETSHAGGRRLG
jgi:2-methylcitrate dehydratase PrpD